MFLGFLNILMRNKETYFLGFLDILMSNKETYFLGFFDIFEHVINKN
jgi:hypothetical protein